MADDKKILRRQHNIIMENRRNLTVTGVMDMDSFDEQVVVVFTEEGELTIKGINLHINKIDVESGDLTMEGEIESLTYSEHQPQKGGLLSRLFK